MYYILPHKYLRKSRKEPREDQILEEYRLSSWIKNRLGIEGREESKENISWSARTTWMVMHQLEAQ